MTIGRPIKLSVGVAAIAVLLGWGIRTAAIKAGLHAFASGDRSRAITLLSPFAGWGSTQAQYALGVLYFRSAVSIGDYQKALSILIPCAEHQSGDAALIVGDIYQNGRVGNTDQGEAVKWYEVAATAGNLEGEDRLGTALLTGLGTKKNPQRAEEVLHKAYEQGDPQAAFLLGQMYLAGEGVPIDFDRAKHFLEVAVAGKVPNSYYELGVMYRDGDGIPKDVKKALSFFRQGFVAGNGDSAGVLGDYYRIGGDDEYEASSVLAYVAYNIGAALGCEACAHKRDDITRKMAPEEVQGAQALSRYWKLGSTLPTHLSPEMLALQSVLGSSRSGDAKVYAATRTWFSVKLTVANRPELSVFVTTDETNPEKQCHACGASVGIVTFENVFPNETFGNTIVQRNAFEFGSWGSLHIPDDHLENGDAPKQQFQLFQIGDHRALVLLDDDPFAQGGGADFSKSAVGFDGLGSDGKLGWRLLGSVSTGGEDERDCGPSRTNDTCSQWEGVVHVYPREDSWPDLIVDATGTKGFEPSKAHWTTQYSFDGTSYKLESTTDKNGIR